MMQGYAFAERNGTAMKIKKTFPKIRADLCRINGKTTIIAAAAVLIVGFLVFISVGRSRIYSCLLLPSFAPPRIIFPIVWTILYLLIGGCAGAVYGVRDKCFETLKYKSLLFFVLMLFLNYVWYPVFFGAGARFIALIICGALIAITLPIRVMFGKFFHTAKLIMTVYLVWLCFSFLLCLAIVLIN